jgi:TM2 domain-containing membrane protein YozV
LNQNNKSHPGTAAVLSFLFNGLGQLYNGQILKGLMIIFISVVSMMILIVGSIIIAFWILGKILSIQLLIWGIALFIIGLILICIFAIYSILDAYQTAAKR